MLEPAAAEAGAGRSCTPAAMTHRMCAPAPLIAPAATFGVHELRADRTLAPAAPGVYGWWFDAVPPGVPLESVVERDGWWWLYVGVAKAHAASRSTLRRRLQNHCRDRCASSTLRRTLAVLLADELRLAFGRTAAGKMTLVGEGEERLTGWMAAHARVAWMTDDEPWKLEAALIRGGPAIPLNIEGSTSTFASVLRSSRALTSEGPRQRATPPVKNCSQPIADGKGLSAI